MTTFSDLVDQMVKELQRPDSLITIASYLNQTVRELHFRPNLGAPVRFDANRKEVEVVTASPTPYTWDVPKVTRFANIEAVYSTMLGDYLPEKTPRNNQMSPLTEPFWDRFWYRSGNQIIFSGVPTGDTIKLSYHEYTRSLAYLESADRLIIFNLEDETYLLADDSEPTQEQLDRETHWMLQRWPSTLAEGVRAKMYKRLGDDTRARMSYSAFETMRLSLWSSEPSTTDSAT